MQREWTACELRCTDAQIQLVVATHVECDLDFVGAIAYLSNAHRWAGRAVHSCRNDSSRVVSGQNIPPSIARLHDENARLVDEVGGSRVHKHRSGAVRLIRHDLELYRGPAEMYTTKGRSQLIRTAKL